jgi:hypothetical protein
MMRVVAAVALAVASGIGGGMVAANVVGPSSVDACYSNSTGALRVAEACRPNETSIVLGTVGFQTRQVYETEWFPTNSWGAVYAMCDEGEVVTGGGHEVAAIGHTWVMNQSEPVTLDGVQGWMVALHHFPAPEGETYPDLSVTAIAVCAPGSSID